MPCYHPKSAWETRVCGKGKSLISFKAHPPTRSSVGILLPCGRCLGCALEKARQWAVRCVHESQMHDQSSFITLTYAPEFLPDYGSLVKEHFTLFMKRLRRAIEPYKIKFFMCGEYGDEGQRPHYHALIFGYSFADRKLHSVRDGVSLYTSELLSQLWPYGFSTCGDISINSASYVARYTLKKIKAKDDEEEMDADNFSGQLPEYVNMSRGGRAGKGLAYSWYTQFQSDVFPCDNVVVKGKIGKPPRYYDKQFELDNIDEFDKIKALRKAKALEVAADNTAERLLVKEKCKEAQIGQLKRGYENG